MSAKTMDCRSRSFFLFILILCALIAGFLPLGHVYAGGVTVCAQDCDFSALQAAIDSQSVPVGQVIRLLDDVHTEAGIVVDKDVILEGLGVEKTILQAHERPGEANDRVLFIAPGATVTIRDITIRHGNPTSEPESGGGVRNEGALTLENVIVRANSASAGGGILNDGTLTLINCTVRDNGSRGGGNSYTECKTGGGLKNLTGEMTLINTTVQNNHAGAKGGGIHVACNGTLILINSTISGNYSAGNGGGVFLNGVGEFTHSTISQNEAKNGGGVYVEGSGEVGLVRGQLSYTNSLIAGNLARMEKYGVADCIIGEHGSIAVNKGNWVGDGQCEAAYSGDPMMALLSEKMDAEPMLTHSTQVHALLPDSPVINLLPSGACVSAEDQWGTARPQGAGCEIGAYELPQERSDYPGAVLMLVMSAILMLIVFALGWLLSLGRT